MKIPITDQFLWDLYESFKATGNIADILFLPRTPYQFARRLSQEYNPIFKKHRNEKNKEQFSRLIYRLKKNNYIKVKNLQGKKAVIITKKGIKKALRVRFKMEDSKKFPKREDGKWLMIMFDIPKKYNKSRNLLRSILQNLGYKMFQHSVWVTPYDVSEKTEELLQYYSLDDYVKVFLIEKL